MYMGVTRVLLVGLLALGSFAVESSAGSEKKCSRRHARQLVYDFIDSYNHGDLQRLDRIFAKEPDFAFYRLFPERQWPSSDDRDELIPYFRERHGHNDHLELIDFYMSKTRGGSPRAWGFTYTIERTSDDLLPWGDGTLSGKGAANCTILVWNASWSP